MTAIAAPVRERPILFSGPMVRAILDGKKSQTRRVVKPQPDNPQTFGISPVWGQGVHRNGEHAGHFCLHAAFNVDGKRVDRFVRSPYGQPGDRLRVQETWAVGKCADGFKPLELDPPTWLGDNGGLWYAADDAKPRHPISERGKWRPGRFMPKRGGFWPSRITLELTDVRVERVQDITNGDAIAEGCAGGAHVEGHSESNPADPYEEYAALWDSLNAKRGYDWNGNPWVWVLSFRSVDA